MRSQVILLKSKRFLPLFITQFFGAFNDNVFKNAFLIWFTYDMAQKSHISASIMVALASLLFILPFFLFSFLAGQLSDKYDKSQLTQIIKQCEIAIMAFCFIGFYFENIYLLLFLLFLMGMHSAFFGPLKYSFLPEHLKERELIGGNALIEGGTFLAILLGTIFGGVIIRLSNGAFIIWVATVSFAIIGWLASRAIPDSKPSDVKLKISFNIAAQTLKIIKYAKENRLVWRAIIGISWFWFVGAMFLSQFPIYTKNIIKGDQFIVTFFLTIFSVGIALGSLVCNKILKSKISARLVPHGLIGMTIGIIIFCVASYFYDLAIKIDYFFGLKEFFAASFLSWIISAALLLVAMSGGIYIVPLYTIMQHEAKEKYLSRIIAANNVMNALFMVLASILMAVLFMLKFNVLQVFLFLALANFFVFFIARKISQQ